MKAREACIPCIMTQAYNTVRRAGSDRQIREVLDRTARYVTGIDLDDTPANLSNFAYRVTREVTGIYDPYRDEKSRHNGTCLGLAPHIRERIDAAADPLRDAVKLAIIGNVIDLGIGKPFDIEQEIERVFGMPMLKDDYPAFRKFLDGGRRNILYLGDNAGEIVFDLLLIERLASAHDITFAVKSGPIINDATMEDAETVGLTDLVRVIETGSDAIGVKRDEISDEFRSAWDAADIIISKGQGNYETVSGRPGNTYFLLKAKCPCVAEELGVPEGNIVFVKNAVDG